MRSDGNWTTKAGIWAIYSGKMRPKTESLPPGLADDLIASNNLPVCGGGWGLEYVRGMNGQREFCYRFTRPDSIDWLQHQKWLPSYTALLGESVEQLSSKCLRMSDQVEKMQHEIGQEKRRLARINDGHPDLDSLHRQMVSDEIEKKQIEVEQLQFQIDAARTVLFHSLGYFEIILPPLAEFRPSPPPQQTLQLPPQQRASDCNVWQEPAWMDGKEPVCHVRFESART